MPRGVNPYDEGRIQGRNVANANSSNIVAPGIVTDGLVLHLDAGNYNSYPISGTTTYDLSDRRNNGTLASGVDYLRADGGLFDFNGTTEKITVPAGPDFAYGTGDFSIDGWINNRAAPPTFGATVFAQTVSGTNYLRIYVIGAAREVVLVFAVSGGGDGNASTGPNGATDNTWKHFAFTRLGTTLTGYINGVAGTPATCSQDFNNTTYVPTIAQYTHTSNDRFTGYIASIRVYKNKGLTPLEVQQNFNATRARFNI